MFVGRERREDIGNAKIYLGVSAKLQRNAQPMGTHQWTKETNNVVLQ